MGREEEIRERLAIERMPDGTRLVTSNGIVLGRLQQDPVSGRWLLDSRDGGWKRQDGQLENAGPEHAEGWAVEEIAKLAAMTRGVIEREHS